MLNKYDKSSLEKKRHEILILAIKQNFITYAQINEILPNYTQNADFLEMKSNLEACCLSVLETPPTENPLVLFSDSDDCSEESAASFLAELDTYNDRLSPASSELRTEDVDKIVATLLIQSMFNQHGTKKTATENDFSKAGRLWSAGQYQEALACIKQYKCEVLDTNPYGYGSEKGCSVSIAIDTYKLMAHCYKDLHQYAEAIKTLDEMWLVLHNVLSPKSLQEIRDTIDNWQIEANGYIEEQTSNCYGSQS